MIFCEYCGSDTELLGSKRIEFAEGVVIREERRKCNRCNRKFYVMLENNGEVIKDENRES
jgi:transcriptional regulator NrdR family protein